MDSNLIKYLPKDKFDFESIEKLKKLKVSEINNLIPQLIEWIQDFNWPIAKDIISILLIADDDILLSEIRKILQSDDNIWKYWCLRKLVKKKDKKFIFALKKDLEKISLNPSKGELFDNVDIEASEILESLDNTN